MNSNISGFCILVVVCLLTIAPLVAQPLYPIGMATDEGKGTAMSDTRWACVSGSTLYVIHHSPSPELRTFDMSDLGSGKDYDTPDDRDNASNENGLLCTADALYSFGFDGITVFDISAPLDPASQVGPTDFSVYNMILDGNRLIAVGYDVKAGAGRVAAYDVSSPLNPTIISDPFDLGVEKQGYAVAVVGSLIYVAEFNLDGGTTALRIIEDSKSGEFSDVDVVALPGFVYHLHPVDGNLFATFNDSVGLYDLTDPTSPTEIDALGSVSGRAFGALDSLLILNGHFLTIGAPARTTTGARNIEGALNIQLLGTFDSGLGNDSGAPHGIGILDRFAFVPQENRILILGPFAFKDGFEE